MRVIENYSPMMQKYLRTKQQYEDCILLYRLGDFYEMFFEDAEKASRILDLTLTGKNCGVAERAPMCGLPYHAVDVYVAKLLQAGERVAICEQLSEPTKGKELVDRDVVRVITPGTVIDSEILEEGRSNYIASIFLSEKDDLGIAFCDMSTGEFLCCKLDTPAMSKDLQELLVSYKPSEIIANSLAIPLSENLDCVKAGYAPSFTACDDSFYNVQRAKDVICEQYKVSTTDGFGFSAKSSGAVASAALLRYLRDTQKRELPHLKPIKFVDKNRFMSIDVKTRRNLELTVSYRENKRKGSLLWLLDKTQTSMGSRTLAAWIDRPLQKASAINARLDAVDELCVNYILTADIAARLRGVADIERIAGKISYNNLTPKDCIALKNSLYALPAIKKSLGRFKCKLIQDIFADIDDLPQVADLINRAIIDEPPSIIKDTDFIKPGYNAELDELFDISRNGASRIQALEEYERNRTGIKTLKLGYNKVFGYYFEISKSLVGQAPENFIRKQTLTTGERFVSPELKELEEKLLTAADKKGRLQKSLFDELRNLLLQYIPSLQASAKAIAALDCLISFANVAQANNYCKPKINTKNTTLNIVDGRHPIVEAYLKRDTFITNDTYLDTQENRTMIITGPNMAGKSTYMRQVALITLMAHIGSFVPARSAEIPIVDKIFTRVGASDDLAFNQSTFMVEMVEVANILNNATSNSLIILDEVGRGTSTFDGLSIAWAVMEFVSSHIRAKTLFATHYHELTDLEGLVDGVKNYRITVKEFAGSVIFLHKIVRGGANKSFGIEVAALAGVPEEVCARAKQIVKLLEANQPKGRLSELNVDDITAANELTAREKEIASILRDLDINRLSPIEAFDILNQLINKVKQ